MGQKFPKQKGTLGEEVEGMWVVLMEKGTSVGYSPLAVS